METAQKTVDVLYVEDNPLDADLTRRQFLRSAPHVALEIAATRGAALAALLQNQSGQKRFDLLLTDLRLPDGSGMELLDDVRRHGLQLPVVVITGSGDEEAAVAALKSGAEDYVVKRQNYLERLPQIVQHSIERHREATARRSRPLRVLYAEHNAADLDLTMRHLGRFAPHIHLEHVPSGEEALRRLLEKPRGRPPSSSTVLRCDVATAGFDVLLLDYRLPGLSALELLKELYQVEDIRIPTVLITGHGDEEVAVQALKLGAYDYIVKNPGYLYRIPGALENAFYRAQLAREQMALRESQARLKENEAKYRHLYQEFHTILDAIPDSISLHSKDLKVVWANRRARPAEAAGEADHIGRHCYELWRCQSDRVENCPVYKSFQSGEPKLQEHTTAGGKTYDVRAIPIADQDGRVESVVRIGRDITEQRKLEQKLRQAYKMEAIGTLAGGIAHDFNNVLSIIMGFTEMTLLDLPRQSPLYANLEAVLDATHRARELVRQILTFSRQTEQERRPVQVSLIVKEALKLLRASLPATIEIRESIQSSGRALADPTQVHQILMNLCANAGYAMKEKGGMLDVELAEVELGPECLFIDPELKPGRYLRLTVGDTGHGMDEATIERIFEPYFTTKSTEEGTGLGLAVVHGIVKSHEGAVTVHSEPDKGTRFTIFLPCIGFVGPEQGRLIPGTSVPGGRERILLVDDERVVVDLVASMLRKLGYIVVSFTEGAEALKVFADEPHAVDLVLTDLTMPKMTGVELAKAMRRIRPDLPVLISTGFSPESSDMLQSAKAIGIHDFLLKPVDLRTLAERVHKALCAV